MEQIVSQSGVLNLSGTDLRKDGKSFIILEDVVKEHLTLFMASVAIDCSIGPKAICIDNSSAYDTVSGLAKVKTYSGAPTEQVVGFVEDSVPANNKVYAADFGIFIDNSLTGGTVGQNVFIDSSGAMTLTPTPLKAGVLLTNTSPIRVLLTMESVRNSRPVVAARYGVLVNAPADSSNPLQWNTKIYDTFDSVTTGTNWNFIAPMPGYYAVSVTGVMTNTGASIIGIFVNGTPAETTVRVSTSFPISFSSQLWLQVGDQVSIRPVLAVTMNNMHLSFIAITRIG